MIRRVYAQRLYGGSHMSPLTLLLATAQAAQRKAYAA